MQQVFFTQTRSKHGCSRDASGSRKSMLTHDRRPIAPLCSPHAGLLENAKAAPAPRPARNCRYTHDDALRGPVGIHHRLREPGQIRAAAHPGRQAGNAAIEIAAETQVFPRIFDDPDVGDLSGEGFVIAAVIDY